MPHRITVIVSLISNIVRMVQKIKKKLMNSDMDMESNTGQMEHITRGNGTTIKQRVKVHSGTPKVMFIAANSKMIWQMVMESIHT